MNANVSTLCFAARTYGAVLLALCCAGCQLFGDPAQENRDRLYARLEEFSQIPPREQLTDQPYIRGRALVVTKKQDPPITMEDPITWGSDKAKELMAEAPEQVETVVVLNYSKDKVATYNIVEGKGGVYGYRESCEVILIDRSIPAVIHRKTFRGPELPPTKIIRETQGEVLSSVDLTTVRNYVMNIPRR
ncbi:MAG TPA: hypothetical protein VF064_07070 [Pyrinomonadaceae bacterium]